jgi:hypothetical protein
MDKRPQEFEEGTMIVGLSARACKIQCLRSLRFSRRNSARPARRLSGGMSRTCCPDARWWSRATPHRSSTATGVRSVPCYFWIGGRRGWAGRAGVSQARMRDAALQRFLRQHGATVILGEYLDQFAEFIPLLDRMRLPYIAQGARHRRERRAAETGDGRALPGVRVGGGDPDALLRGTQSLCS